MNDLFPDQIEQDRWVLQEHPVFGDNGSEPARKTGISNGILPIRIWTRGDWSIIPPCLVTNHTYELYHPTFMSDVKRFDTLEEAKQHVKTYESS